MSGQIRVMPNDELEPGPSTAGMVRRTATASQDFWLGEVRTEAGAVSAWHHHGAHTTRGYVVAGRLRFEFGAGGEASVEAKAGDFFEVPPHTIHRESNPSGDEQILVGIRIGSGPSVINVDGPDTR